MDITFRTICVYMCVCINVFFSRLTFVLISRPTFVHISDVVAANILPVAGKLADPDPELLELRHVRQKPVLL